MNQERRVVVGVNGSMASLAALRWAAREARLRQSRLHVVCAQDPGRARAAPYAGHARRLMPGEAGQPTSALLQAMVHTALGPRPQVTVDAEVVDGLAAKVLIDRAAGADLLVLGDAATSQFEVIGPVARACLRHAPCPVVVVGTKISKPVPA
jgi:nucleotide-binding universal stress UspA family protein